MIVADANLIVARCMNGGRSETARRIYDRDPVWIAPKLWQAEFVSALLKYQRATALSAADRARALFFAESFMHSMDYDSDLHEVTAVAMKTQCSAYDSCYIALAEEMRTKLVTFDGGILANAPHVAVSPEQFLAA